MIELIALITDTSHSTNQARQYTTASACLAAYILLGLPCPVLPCLILSFPVLPYSLLPACLSCLWLKGALCHYLKCVRVAKP